MAQKENDVYLDFDGCIEILKKRGEQVDKKSTVKQIGYTTQAYGKITKKAPKSVEMVYRYLNENKLGFNDLVRER